MNQYSHDIIITSSTDILLPEGAYTAAFNFSIPKLLLVKHGSILVSWGQLSDFSFTLDKVILKKQDILNALDGVDLHNGAGPGGTRPTCVAGIVFEAGCLTGFFGELFVPVASSTPFYNVSFGQSNYVVNNNVNIGTNPEDGRGTIVASGHAGF